jgi:phosphate transport system substrate-binding protein
MIKKNVLQSKQALTVSLMAISFSFAACTASNENEVAATDDLSGTVKIDGSSTVFPISEAMAEEFMAINPDVRATVGVSGTGGGFERFCNGEIDIADASRPIGESEIEACQSNGIEFIELPVAQDALTVVVNKENDFVDCLTTEELKRIWEPSAQGQITNWNQVRPEFPDRPLSLYGPGTDSGTFDYFTDAVVGEEGASRGDYNASEDDNIIVRGVANDTNALGYFGFAYYEENQDQLKAIAIDNGDPSDGEGCVAPSREAVNDGTYQPLARPLFIYARLAAAESNFAANEFVEFYLQKDNSDLIRNVGYIPLEEEIYDKAQARFQNQETGTIFEGGTTVGVNLKEAL